ncbi:hypothetical protein LTR36_008307 [Oleoguttula mirabilis]|uniref:Uncharacterized protein n=1 Tax=Oleoguttula mirabilis TaxID=1507867 RepID=A0AAV9J823_9PEZI|nr:hypothetical protein LTR36_008307 [Oleoguttula mirabilis]
MQALGLLHQDAHPAQPARPQIDDQAPTPQGEPEIQRRHRVPRQPMTRPPEDLVIVLREDGSWGGQRRGSLTTAADVFIAMNMGSGRQSSGGAGQQQLYPQPLRTSSTGHPRARQAAAAGSVAEDTAGEEVEMDVLALQGRPQQMNEAFRADLRGAHGDGEEGSGGVGDRAANGERSAWRANDGQ